MAVETRSGTLDESLLWPEEDKALGEVVPGRRWDWVMGRRCAREAIEALGMEPLPVLSGEKREPLWPGGVVGAITHTSGYAAAAVGRAVDIRSIGVDAEPDEPLPKGVLRRVAFESELEWVQAAGIEGVAHADRLLFTAKEAVYKAWFPVAQRWLGFDDARVTVDAASQAFEAEILVDGPISTMRGRYLSTDGIVMAAVEVS